MQQFTQIAASSISVNLFIAIAGFLPAVGSLYLYPFLQKNMIPTIPQQNSKFRYVFHYLCSNESTFTVFLSTHSSWRRTSKLLPVLVFVLTFYVLVFQFIRTPPAVGQTPEIASSNQKPVDYVNVLVGTYRNGQKPGSVNNGQTFPSVGMPFSMTHWTAQTQDGEDKCVSPYYYNDSSIQGFRGSHWLSGSCAQDYGSFTLMPMTGALKVSPTERASSFSHAKEVASPAYYAVMLDNYGVQAEMTGTTRVGFMRFTFLQSKTAYIVLNPNPRLGKAYVKVIPERNEIIGYNPVYRIYQGAGQPAGFNGYFVARFDRQFAAYGTANGKVVNFGSQEAQGGREQTPAAFVQFAAHAGEFVQVKIGTSFTSIEQARKNLDSEISTWNFDSTRDKSTAIWNSSLGAIEVAGGTKEQRSIFYTALYHAQLLPRLYSDVDGLYPSFDGNKATKIAQGFQYYDDFSMWDTYRALHPLLVLTDPKRTSDIVKSLLAKAEQGGWLPDFPAWNSYTSEMIGDHAIATIVDAYMKGIRDFDAQKAYAVMRKNAMQMPLYSEYINGKGRRALNVYLQYGYIPLEEPVKEAFHQREQTSRTLEYAYDDFTLAQLAHALGKTDDYSMFIHRAYNYKNVFDKSVGFVRGRHQNGSWATPFDPTIHSPDITESTSWQYTWYVPHDVQGLINLMGGRTSFVTKLDTFFNQKLYDHGNEPGHQIPYLYNYAGAPWKTQARVRQIIQTGYQLTPSGLSGNDDAGELSVWYVFSAMGFYPVCPGLPSYGIGSPIFNQVTIHLPNGKSFSIRADGVSDQNKYIQSATMNGQPYNKPWFNHGDIVNGGTLSLIMGSKPNQLWGSAIQVAPPSMTSSLAGS